MSKKAFFNLEEESAFKMKISLKGETSLPNVKPVARFIISENTKDGIAMMFPATQIDGGIWVQIPPMKNFCSETKDYTGKLEIIVGNRYFSPVSFDVKFIKELEIEAEPIFEGTNIVYDEESPIEFTSKKVTEKPIKESSASKKEPELNFEELISEDYKKHKQEEKLVVKTEKEKLADQKKKEMLINKFRKWLKE